MDTEFNFSGVFKMYCMATYAISILAWNGMQDMFTGYGLLRPRTLFFGLKFGSKKELFSHSLKLKEVLEYLLSSWGKY